MSRISVHEVTDAEDNKDRIVLKPEQFRAISATAFADLEASDLEKQIRTCANRETEVAHALDTLRKKGPRRLVSGLLEWEEHDGLLYYRGKLYIPNNKQLRTAIIKTCHDAPTAGHPGKHGTLELLSCSYWWPRMAADSEKYVLGCEKC